MELATDIFKDGVRVRYTAARNLLNTAAAENACIMLAKAGNRDARNLLFEKQIPSLIDLASKGKYARYKGNAAELVAAVMVVFDRALELFEPSRGIRFWTFLAAHAMNAMNKEVYEDRLIHVPENYVKKGQADKMVRIESGHAPVKDCEDACLFDTICGDTGDEIVEDSAQGEYRDITAKVLGVLTGEEKDLVRKCYLEEEADTAGNATAKPWSITSVAKFYGTSKDLMRKRHADALAKLRKEIDADRDWCIDQRIA